MAYGDFKDLNRRIAADKVLCENAFNVAEGPEYGYQHGIASMVYKFFDKNNFGETVKNKIISNKEFTEELHKPIIGKFKKRKYLHFS